LIGGIRPVRLDRPLHDFPVGRVVPAVARPESVAGVVVRIDEDIASSNPGLLEPRKTELGEARAYAMAAVCFRDGKVIEKAGATVVAAEDRAYDFAAGRHGNRAEAGIALQKSGDSLFSIGLAYRETFDPGP
jgi:hypothetical protein